MRLNWEPRHVDTVENGRWGTSLREPRMGVMLHFDGSSNDPAAVSWFRHPECNVSYNVLVLDDGDYVRIAPDDARAWHAGWCRTSDPERLPYEDANSAFYGISAATNGHTDVTPRQILAIAWLVRRWFAIENWDPDETWRVVGHSSEAVYPDNHPKAGQRGRRSDPEGGDLSNPIYSPNDIRSLLPLLPPPVELV